MDDDDQAPPTTTPLNPQQQRLKDLQDLQALQQQQQENPLAALNAQLEAAQKQPKQTGDDDGLFAGMTAGSMMVGLVLSTIGIGMLRYAKVTVQWIWAICGVLLMTIPFFVTDTLILSVVGVGIIGLTLLVRRFVTF